MFYQIQLIYIVYIKAGKRTPYVDLLLYNSQYAGLMSYAVRP